MKKEKKEDKNKNSATYTPTEVGTMLESIRKDIKLIAEGHSGLDRRLESLEIEVHGNSRRLDMVELTTRLNLDKLSHLEDAVSKWGKEFKETREEFKKEIHSLGNRLAAVETRG